jgi:hypothetical protein
LKKFKTKFKKIEKITKISEKNFKKVQFPRKVGKSEKDRKTVGKVEKNRHHPQHGALSCASQHTECASAKGPITACLQTGTSNQRRISNARHKKSGIITVSLMIKFLRENHLLQFATVSQH